MQPIGWTIACLLLAAGFSKCASTESTALDHGQVEATKILPISKDTVDPDVQVVREFLDGLIDGGTDQGSKGARTFGVKRIQFMLMPMVYKMGVMMTMLTVLTVISLKGLLIGVTLLVLKLSTIIAKFTSGWHENTSQQPIHVHVHNSLPIAHNQAYSGWMPHSGPDGDEHYYYRG
ncbi:uncharacterized protein LOC117226153 [Megalopta genalis]|uniref:uncharacterized protein LOC117226153 n=1 Tax=Megalopta genalis TaxID=115081 RepID=UPI001442FF68|nr:uncharacterized protein LOC117226153 [Megalopta genalis]